jgi:hypothetical protein
MIFILGIAVISCFYLGVSAEKIQNKLNELKETYIEEKQIGMGGPAITN